MEILRTKFVLYFEMEVKNYRKYECGGKKCSGKSTHFTN
jgi:hypothetical protein